MHERRPTGLVDTNIVILRDWIDPQHLPLQVAISAVTLGELSAGPHMTNQPAEQARRIAVLQRTEHEFDPLPYEEEAARLYGRMYASTVAAGRQPRRRTADLMIAATAATEGLPLFTTNPDDFTYLDDFVEVIAVPRPSTPFG